jgi:hypothetical protein
VDEMSKGNAKRGAHRVLSPVDGKGQKFWGRATARVSFEWRQSKSECEEGRNEYKDYGVHSRYMY